MKNKTTFKTLFKEMDLDNSGHISKEEFRKFLSKHGEDVREQDVEAMLKYMDIS